jgi:hypothetical protein
VTSASFSSSVVSSAIESLLSTDWECYLPRWLPRYARSD